MTLKEKVIKRLREGFGYDIPFDVKWKTNQAHGSNKGEGAFSWYFCDYMPIIYQVGACVSVKECLKWKRWVINLDELEISEYSEDEKSLYSAYHYLIENI
jgi:hypothetical protein